nr:MAG TPA: hypothetical protein [Caudoviricetes sp.]
MSYQHQQDTKQIFHELARRIPAIQRSLSPSCGIKA